MSSDILNPISEPGMLYPVVPAVRGKHKKCPKCQSSNRTLVKGMVFKQKFDGYILACGWDNSQWYVASDLILNSIIEDQITRIYEFTHETKREFGAIVLRTSRGVCLDFTQVGEEYSVNFTLTRPLQSDEEILGSIHCHPITDTFSPWDLATFLGPNKWEKVSMVVGANGTLSIAIKTPETRIVKNCVLATEEWQREGKTTFDLSKEFGFLLYVGPPDNLTLMNGEAGSTSLDKLLQVIVGSKSLS